MQVTYELGPFLLGIFPSELRINFVPLAENMHLKNVLLSYQVNSKF